MIREAYARQSARGGGWMGGERKWRRCLLVACTTASSGYVDVADGAGRLVVVNQSINHFIVLKKDMHCTTHDLQYMGWSQQNAS